MKLNIACQACDDAGLGRVLVPVELTDARRFQLDCPNGHHEGYAIENKQFEFLFDMGALALLDGYYREAVSSFAAALERFYEFYVHAVCSFRGIPETDVAVAWKHMHKQSERQLGAFVTCQLIDAPGAPHVFPESLVKMRNDAIHKGVFTPRVDALTYGEAVRHFVSKHLLALHRRHPKMLFNMVFDPLDIVNDPTVQRSHNRPTIIRVLDVTELADDEEFPKGTLEDCLRVLEQKRPRIYSS